MNLMERSVSTFSGRINIFRDVYAVESAPRFVNLFLDPAERISAMHDGGHNFVPSGFPPVKAHHGITRSGCPFMNVPRGEGDLSIDNILELHQSVTPGVVGVPSHMTCNPGYNVQFAGNGNTAAAHF